VVERDPADKDAVIERVLHAQRALRGHFTEHDPHPLLDVNLTMSQLKLLLILTHLDGASSQELAGRAGVSLATLTGIVDRLVAQGLVRRSEDPKDRRVRRLQLTAAGAEQVDRLIAAGEERQQRLLARLDPEGLDLVARAMELLLAAARAEG
jgi:DNA-binding MarR family transcriptional regulator